MLFSDEDLMVVALSEANKVSKKLVLPNPRVGAAILSLEQKLFFGHHKRSGSHHAEVEAIQSALNAGADLCGATMAITLEPCAHFGKTPPCVDEIIQRQFKKVIVGIKDPDSRTCGKSLVKLREAGIEVVEGVMAEACHELNKEWLFAKSFERPYVYLKLATSLDGLWTAENGESKWITGVEARAHSHNLRSEVGAMLTSLRTLEMDDSHYSARRNDGELSRSQPDLVVMSRRQDWGPDWALGVFPSQLIPGRMIIESRSEPIFALLARLYKSGIFSVLVECGPTLSSEFLKTGGAVQEIWHYFGAKYLGGNGKRLEALNEGTLPGFAVKPKDSLMFSNGDLFVRTLT